MRERPLTTRTGIFATLTLAAALCAAAPAGAGEWQDLEEIRRTAADYVARDLDRAGIQARAGQLDGRLRLARCGAALEAFLPAGMRAGGSTTVGVRCSGERPWKVFVPVRVQALAPVLVAKRPLARGAKLSAADLDSVEQDTARLPYGYFDDPSALAGRELRRPVAAGTVIVPAMVAAPRLVRRGQTVRLSATQGGIAIAMTGRALGDGALDQRIRVENLSSGRVVEGIVRSGERVEVLLR